MHKLNISWTVFSCTFQISYSYILILPRFHGSNENIFEIKTFIQPYMLNSQLFSNINTCTSSTKQDLYIYVHKTAKREIEFQLTWKWKFLFTRPQALIHSRSTPLHLLWSFKQEESVETTWIYFNFQLPLPWECSWTARFLAQLQQIDGESYSVKQQDQQSARILKNYVKKNANRRERKNGGNLKIQIWNSASFNYDLGLVFIWMPIQT